MVIEILSLNDTVQRLLVSLWRNAIWFFSQSTERNIVVNRNVPVRCFGVTLFKKDIANLEAMSFD